MGLFLRGRGGSLSPARLGWCVFKPMRLSQACCVFFRILQDAAFAGRVASLDRPAVALVPTLTPAAGPRRNEALTLLAVLQREGRLVDFLLEPIGSFTDAQIGAAAREVHRGCGQAIERIFAPAPVVATAEGSNFSVTAGYDPGRIRLTGKVAGAPPCAGTVAHPGWEAHRCELPEWTGTPAAARVIAPAEVEIR